MLSRSGVIKFIIVGFLLFGVGLIILNFISYNRRQTDILLKKKQLTYEPRQIVSVVEYQNKINVNFKSNTKLNKKVTINRKQINADFKSNIKPEKLIINKNQTKTFIRKYKIQIKNEQLEDILVRETGTGNYHILLLHGLNSSSKIWEDIGTLQYLSDWGYRAFAIDITNNQSNVQWLKKLIDTLQLKNLVIISPSISGRITLKYIFQLNKNQKLIRGFVPIAPVGINEFQLDDYKQMSIPTLIVHGENDTKCQTAFEKLQNIPKSQILLIKNASHQSFIEKPMIFHNQLRQFLYHIYRKIYLKSFTKSNKNSTQNNRQHNLKL